MKAINENGCTTSSSINHPANNNELAAASASTSTPDSFNDDGDYNNDLEECPSFISQSQS